jgi:membrane protein
VLFAAAKNFDRDRCFDQAATISYFALLSILPLSILLIAMGAAVVGSVDAAERGLELVLRDLVQTLGPDIFAQAREMGSQGGRLGWPFLLLALWTASKVFSKVEAGLDRVFRVENRRSFPVRKIFSFGLVALLAFVMLVLLVLSSAVAAFDRFVDSTALAVATSNPLYIALDNMASRYIAPWVLTVFTFSFIYKVVPACTVSWRAAALAGLIAGSLWEAIKNAFAWYISDVADYARTYGTLETVVVFIIWVNVSCVLLLWGGEVAALVNGARKIPGIELAEEAV